MKKKKLSKKEIQRRQRKSMQRWYHEYGVAYSRTYRRQNPDIIRVIFNRYKYSIKGQRAIKKYESKPERKASKAFWNFKKRLELKVENGQLSKFEMGEMIRKRVGNA